MTVNHKVDRVEPAEVPPFPHIAAMPELEMLKVQAEQKATELGNQLTMEALITAYNAGYARCEADNRKAPV